MPVLVGECNPQLESPRHGNPVIRSGHRSRRQDREFRMRDSVAGGHDVQFTGFDHNIASHAVAVPNGPFQRPCYRLETAVGVGENAHCHTVRPKTVQEAPSANGGQTALGQGAEHVHGTDAAQRNFTLGP
ncbi:hypothetical protein StoSoilB13_15670 [Arthrobacter sp. StoSoilB13]|nr:hypothetical protein StoSoilB13_15670 [Arthrobacter sp. StoSoilB13]